MKEIIEPYEGGGEFVTVEKVKHNKNGTITVYARNGKGQLLMRVCQPGEKVIRKKRT